MVDGAPGTLRQAESYEHYYSSFSEDTCATTGVVRGAPATGSATGSVTGNDSWTRRHHRLRRDAGDGTIGVLDKAGDLRIVRYDAAFDQPHALGYSFPANRFELEICFTGRMKILEQRAGRGELTGGGVSLSPSRSTSGTVTFPAEERYRAISVSGSYESLDSLLGSVGVEYFRRTISGCGTDPGYLGATPAVPAVRTAGERLYDDVGVLLDKSGPAGAGEILTLESQVMSVLARLLTAGEDAMPGRPVRRREPHPVARQEQVFEAHEIAGVRSVPQLMWERRHDLPTLRDLARLVHMSPKRLTAAHREVYGTTVMEQHRRRCVDHACDLLASTDWTVEHIGHECGYATSSNFIYAFRLRRGCTPGDYRQSRRMGGLRS